MGKNKSRLYGFSLLELIVVVTIIGLLTAIAIPTYKSYALTARLSSVVPAVEALITQAISFSQIHGHFPTPTELNLAGANSIYATAKAITPYGASPSTSFAMFDNSIYAGESGGVNCGKHGGLGLILDTTLLGFGSDVNIFQINCNMYHVNGSFERNCVYGYGILSGQSQTGNIIPGWLNQNSTTAWDDSVDLALNTPLVAKATCQ